MANTSESPFLSQSDQDKFYYVNAKIEVKFDIASGYEEHTFTAKVVKLVDEPVLFRSAYDPKGKVERATLVLDYEGDYQISPPQRHQEGYFLNQSLIIPGEVKKGKTVTICETYRKRSMIKIITNKMFAKKVQINSFFSFSVRCEELEAVYSFSGSKRVGIDSISTPENYSIIGNTIEISTKSIPPFQFIPITLLLSYGYFGLIENIIRIGGWFGSGLVGWLISHYLPE